MQGFNLRVARCWLLPVYDCVRIMEMIKLPKDRNDWTVRHAVIAYQFACRKFDDYEAKADFSYEDLTVKDTEGLEPDLAHDVRKILFKGALTEALYLELQLACDLAYEVCNVTNVLATLPNGTVTEGTSAIEYWCK
jgi:hypothetical protein